MIELLKKFFDRGHGRFLGMLSDYIDGELSDAELTKLEDHLASCPTCSEELESQRATVLMLRRMPEVEVPRSFRLAPVEAPYSQPSPERPMFLWAMRVSTALAVVAFTLMIAGNVSGLWENDGIGDGGGHPAARDFPFEITPEPPWEPTTIPMMEEDEPGVMMEPEPAPPVTPMMMSEPTPAPELMEDTEETATDEPEAMMEPEPAPRVTPMIMSEPTPAPELMESREETAADEPVGDFEEDDSSTFEAVSEPSPTPIPTPVPITLPTPTPRPAPTATSTPTLEPTPAPTAFLTPKSTPWPWTGTDEEMEDDGEGGVVLGLTIGLGVLAGALALGTLYLTVRRRRGGGVGS